MVLAIGIVVDDAIVVVENVARHIQNGHPPKEAAKLAMTEVTGPVIALVVVLAAVFLPVAFLGGITGELYQQFAITITLSVVLSGIVALTLSPALCALILKPDQEGENRFWKKFNDGFDWTQNRYVGTVGTILKHAVLSLAIFGVLLFVSWGLFQALPSSFLPEEDQGYFISIIQLPDGASKQRTIEVLNKVESYLLSVPEVHSTDALAGQNFVFNTRGANQATMFVPLHHWDDRTRPDQHVKALIGNAFKKFAEIPEALILAFNAPSIRGLGATGGFSLQLQDPSGGDFKQFAAMTQQFVSKAQQDPAIGAIGTSFRVTAPRLYARVDRERAKALGVPISEVFDTLQAYFGNFYINDFIKFGRVYRVQTEALPEFRSSPDDISKIYVRARNAKGSTMIPLDTVVSTEFTSGPDTVTHFNGFNTAVRPGCRCSGI